MWHHFVARTATLYKFFIRVEHFDGTIEYFNDVEHELIDQPVVMGVECHIKTKQ